MTGVPADNPIKILRGPSDPEPIQIEKIIGLDNPEFLAPRVGSLGDVSSQPEIARTSGRAGAPNPLHDIITIYDDEESSQDSLVTPIQITEEKEPEKVSSPVPDAPIQNLPQSDQEVKSILDNEILYTPGTQVDSPKDELGLGEQERGIPQQEINISIDYYQVSTEPAPDSSILSSTLPSDEQQPED
jgi:hypothetical protein